MRILWILSLLPYPLDLGGKFWNYYHLKELSEYHDITIISFYDPDYNNQEAKEVLSNYCSEIKLVPKLSKYKPKGIIKIKSRLTKFFKIIVFRTPLYVQGGYTESNMAREIELMCNKHDYDIVQIIPSRMAGYVQNLPHKTAKILIVDNIEHERNRRFVSTIRNPIKRLKRYLYDVFLLKNWELKMWSKFDHLIDVSHRGKNKILSYNPLFHVSVVENPIDYNFYQSFKCSEKEIEEESMVFVGRMDNRFNIDGILWFYHKVFPLVKKKFPDVKLYIVGGGKLKYPLQNSSIILTGYVNTIPLFIQHCAISIVPLRAGGGTKLKVLEALAMGKPIVSTPIGCEGIEVEHGLNILIEESAEGFANAIIRLLNDKNLRNKLSKEAIKLAVKYDYHRTAKKLDRIYNMIKQNGINAG